MISAKRRAHWLLRNGTTTAEIKSGYGLALEPGIKMLRIARALGETATLRVVATVLGAQSSRTNTVTEEKSMLSC